VAARRVPAAGSGHLNANLARWVPVRVIAAGVLYFAIVFGTGFVLGPIRVLIVAPAVGERIAVLLEAPLMLAAIVFAARWINRRFPHLTPPASLAAGLVALAFVLAAELAVMTFFWRMSLPRYLAARDPVGLAAYAVLLAAFAAMPLVVARRRRARLAAN
jgi:preprotein translocase subunit SecY